RKEMDSDEYDHGNDNYHKDPPAQLNALFKISNTGCHRSKRVQPWITRMSRIQFCHSSFVVRFQRLSVPFVSSVVPPPCRTKRNSPRATTFAGLTAPAPGADRRPRFSTSGRDAVLPQIPECFPGLYRMQAGPTPDWHGQRRFGDSTAALREIHQ